MSVKPVLLSELRRTAVQHHQRLVGTGEYNRFSPLSSRPCTFSFGKRKLDPSDNNNVNSTKAPRYDPSLVFKQLKGQEKVLEDVKGILEQADKVELDKLPPEVKEVMGFYGSALKMLLKSQEQLTSTLVDTFATKQHLPTIVTSGEVSDKGKQVKPPAPEISPEAEKKRKVKQAIREAEKKTILFNLDLGKAPTMNRDTLAKKVTLALSSKVQAGEHDYDIADAEEVLDDILSCSKLEFLGATTKKFFNKKNVNDVRNDTMCTMPVRFEFKDRVTRIEAETNLRKVCKVSCSVPYPKRLRDILDNLVTQGKKLAPNCFIRTRVNVDTLSIDVHAKTKEGWKDLHLKTCIPLDILDVVSTDNAAVVPMNIS
jgi:hypothetical protein